MHRAGILSAVYLMERESISKDEAVIYWKTNAFETNVDKIIKVIAKIEGWDELKINWIKERYADNIYPGENGITKYLKNYRPKAKRK